MMAGLTVAEIIEEVRRRHQMADAAYDAVPEARKSFHAGSVGALGSLIEWLEFELAEPEAPFERQEVDREELQRLAAQHYERLRDTLAPGRSRDRRRFGWFAWLRFADG